MTYDITRYISWIPASNILPVTIWWKFRRKHIEYDVDSIFSTRLYLNIRFDDAVPADPTFKYSQINEVVSFS